MDKKISDWININFEGQDEIWGLLPDSLNKKREHIKDTYSDYEKRLTKSYIETCNAILKLRPNNRQITKWKSEYEKALKIIEINNPLPKVNLGELIEDINNAFFRLEIFMDGGISNYLYFGFNDAFTKLFFEIRKPENYTYKNCILIGEYWALTAQIVYDYDKSDFENSEAYENDFFCEDCEEIDYLNWDRVGEFAEFTTPDQIDEAEQKFSITDIIKAQQALPQPPQGKVIKPQPTFEELFYNPEYAEPCLKILGELEPPLIDALNNYIGKGKKGVFPLWVKILQQYGPKPFIKPFEDMVYKNALNQKINGLNLSKDASEFRKQYERIERSNIGAEIKALLSQYSQQGK